MIKHIKSYFLIRFSPEDRHYFRGRLLVKFALASAMMAFGYWISTFFTGFIVARFLTMGSAAMFIILLFGLRVGMPLRLVSRLLIFYCWLTVFILTLFSGGIHSVVLPWISLIPVTALLLMGPRAGWLWGGFGVATVLFFLFTDQRIIVPDVWQGPKSDLRTALLYIGLLVLSLWITYLFHRQGADLLRTIQEQNRELGSAQETLEKQRDEISMHNENLEAEVDKRTHELLDYNQQLEQFAFIASHNLRAPVASLLGLGHLLEVSVNNKQDIEQICVNMINTARELDRVVRDLSTILEIRKSSHAVLVSINLEEEVKLVRVNLERELNDTRAELQADFSDVPTVQSVRPLMDSILMNLISNAIKYRHPDRAPRITIRSERHGEEVCLSVSDNGLGIDLEAFREKLFTLYGRFHSHVDGKGLGLYLVKTHVMAMGGRIEVDSEPEKGTTFRVFLKYTGRRPENT